MSGRRRRSEPSWEKKDEKWSNLEINDEMPPGNSSGRQSWERLQGNRNVSEDGDISRDRHRMQTDQAFDDWEKQYNSRPSDDSYNMPYRARDRVIGGSARMCRDQDQIRSPNRSRSRSPGRGVARDISRSRSRNRDWEITRARSRSPLYDDRRYESNEYPSIRNNSRLSSRNGDKQLDDNLTENRSRRPDYTSGSRYNDYQRDDRNIYDDQNRRHQTNQNRVACRFFLAGNCRRDDCRFSHDVPESGHHDGRSRDNSRDHNLRNKKEEWHGRHPHDDDLNPSDFSDIPKSNFGDNKQKTWDGPTWDDMESGGFDHKSRIQGHKSDDERNLWDRPSRDGVDASGFPDVGKSNFNSDNKNRSGNNSARDNKKSWNDANSDDKKKLWDRPSWDDVDTAPGFSDVDKPKPGSDNKNRPGHIPLWDSKNYEDVKQSWNDANSDDKKKLWDGPSWDDVDGAPGFPDVKKLKPSSDYKNRPGNIPSRDSKNYEDGKKSWNGVQSGNNIDGKTKNGDGPLWDGVDFGKPSGGDGTSSATSDKFRKLDSPGFTEMTSKKNDMLPQWTTATKGRDLESHAMGGQTQHVMSQPISSQYVDATVDMIPEVPIGSSHLKHQVQEHSNQQMLTSGNDSIQNVHDIYLTGTINPFNGSNIQSNGHVQGTFVHMDSPKQTENGQALNSSDIGGSQAKNDANALPASLSELSQQGQLPQLYTDLNLTGAIDFLKSLPKSACNEDTRANVEQNTATAMDVKASISIGSMPGSITQEKEPVGNLEGTDNKVVENDKQQEETMILHNTETQGKEEEGDVGNDEKAMRQFKVALVEFAKEILKPKWKEGKLSRDVHKTVVKKVVDKVTSTIQVNQIPRTQAKIEQYLAYSKPKITKLVEAYVERFLKA